MNTILQLTHKLTARPAVARIDSVELRHFQGPADIGAWLELRGRAFARQKIGVGAWDAGDFSREFLDKPWWRPETMWFAEARGVPTVEPRPVGTITLARRGAAPGDTPVVHWLIVAPGHRRRGIGRLLVTTLEAAVWDAGGRQVWLETHSGWREAAQLYESLGYDATNG